jgi:methionyl-tRNA formyltransferase
VWDAVAIDAPTKPSAAPLQPGVILGLIDGALQVACGAGVLAIRHLQPAGRRVMSAQELLNASASGASSLIGQQLG